MAKEKITKAESVEIAMEQETINSIKCQDLSSMSLTDLLTLKDATKFLIDYYGNYAKANTGNYNFNAEELYKTAKHLTEKYNKGYNQIISAIENEVNKELYEKTLA